MVFGPSWGLLGASWGHLGAILEPPGAVLGPLGAPLEPLGSVFWRYLATAEFLIIFGAILDRPWPK